ncbi:hypothetical protein BGW80DRAFT_1249727 [Lactifluus volemus]|nr:hypothetical protein BGW80DRAFT_1249727 [Lactifluus volemus]
MRSASLIFCLTSHRIHHLAQLSHHHRATVAYRFRRAAPTNALSRTLSLASKKLFGTGVGSPRSPPRFATLSYGGQGTGSSSPRTCSTSMGGGVGEVDPVQDELLGALEQLAQKTRVITRWADEMYEFVKGVPQKPLPDLSKFAPRESENEKVAARRRNVDVQAGSREEAEMHSCASAIPQEQQREHSLLVL